MSGRIRSIGWLCITFAVAWATAFAHAQDGLMGEIEAAKNIELVESPDWPRTYTRNNHRLIVYQPQIDRWDDFKILSARAAVAITPRGEDAPDFGTIRFTAATDIDYDTHTVLVGQREMAGMLFPDLESSRYLSVRGVLEGLLPEGAPMTMSLDEIVAYLDIDEDIDSVIAMNADPPLIIWSDVPAIVVTIDGPTVWADIDRGPLLAATNASVPLFRDPKTDTYWLLRDAGAITTSDIISGVWTPATKLPAELDGLGPVSAENAVVPKVNITHELTAMILTDGAPKLRPIPETRIAEVTNTKSDLFLFTGDYRYYYLLGGRWFRAGTLDGPWSAASATLPEEFAKIPPGDPAGRVLVTVPGTPEARSAKFMSSVPRTARISRSEAKVDVTYDGKPEFALIDGSDGVSAAVNSEYQVFEVVGRYFCCYQAVWFEALAPTGPWSVCTAVPPAIYTIPALNANHNVTDVLISGVTPDYVQTQHTGQYTGEVVTLGLITAGIVYAVTQADNVNFSGSVHLGGINVSWNNRPKQDPFKAWGNAVVKDKEWTRLARGQNEPGARRGPGALNRTERGDFYSGADGQVFRRGANGSWEQRAGNGWKQVDSADRAGKLNTQHKARVTGTRTANEFNRRRGGGGRSRGGGGRR